MPLYPTNIARGTTETSTHRVIALAVHTPYAQYNVHLLNNNF